MADLPIDKVVVKKNTLSSMQLSCVNVGKDSDEEKKLELVADIKGAEGSVSWKSSNEKVVKVSGTALNVGTVEAVGRGTATVTCAAQDGSGKKTSFKVKVVTPVSDIKVRVAGNSDELVAFGKSASLVATVEKAYGKPANSKVIWDYEIYATDGLHTFDDPSQLVKVSDEGTERIKREKKLFTMSGNKLTVNKNYMDNYLDYKDYLSGKSMFVVKAIARAADGYGAEGCKYLYPLRGTKSFSYYRVEEDGSVTELKSVTVDYVDPKTDPKGEYVTELLVSRLVDGAFEHPGRYDAFYVNEDDSKGKSFNMYYVSNSNPNVVTPYLYGTENGTYLYLFTQGKGTANITLTAMDGTNEKKTLTVNVK
jgi:hypothetical protein